MVYRKIATHNGNDILEKLSEEETAAYYRNKECRKRKENRETEVGAWVGSLLAGSFFIGIIVVYIVGGYTL